MTRDEIIARLRARKPEIRAKGVLHLALFGSRVRGDYRPDSDLDVLVDIDPTLRILADRRAYARDAGHVGAAGLADDEFVRGHSTNPMSGCPYI